VGNGTRIEFQPRIQLMKSFERLTLLAVATASAGYLIRQAIRARADELRARADERWCRLAAGESAFERTQSGFHRITAAANPGLFRLRSAAPTRSGS
jgi:hypothetical protein